MSALGSRIAGKVRRFVQSHDKSTYVDKFLRLRPGRSPWRGPQTYADRAQAERARFRDVLEVNALPPIFHYWSNAHLRPLLEETGLGHPDDWFAQHLFESARRVGRGPHRFASIGAGNCDTEVRVAARLQALGLEDFTIECIDLSPEMLGRGRSLAQAQGVVHALRFVEGDFNHWRPSCLYSGVMANQSLHHVVELEHLFAEIRLALCDGAAFVASDIIGRNGHQRWPESMAGVQAFWRELPEAYRYNHLLKRHEPEYLDWDCAGEGFEGVRAQDILPLLLERFHVHRFVGFGSVIDPFVDRAFGHNFDPGREWDRDFIDRVHAFDERGFADGSLTPTHMFAVMTAAPLPSPWCARGLTAAASARDPDAAPVPGAGP